MDLWFQAGGKGLIHSKHLIKAVQKYSVTIAKANFDGNYRVN